MGVWESAAAPNPKLQAPEKSPAPNLKQASWAPTKRPKSAAMSNQRFGMREFGVWRLELFWCLELGAWSFSGAWSLFSTRNFKNLRCAGLRAEVTWGRANHCGAVVYVPAAGVEPAGIFNFWPTLMASVLRLLAARNALIVVP